MEAGHNIISLTYFLPSLLQWWCGIESKRFFSNLWVLWSGGVIFVANSRRFSEASEKLEATFSVIDVRKVVYRYFGFILSGNIAKFISNFKTCLSNKLDIDWRYFQEKTLVSALPTLEKYLNSSAGFCFFCQA